MKVIITGATGMVGQGVVDECLKSNEVESVLVITRQSTHINHPKLKEVLIKDFTNLSEIKADFIGFDACLFCLGTSSFRKSASDYRFITHDLTLTFAKTLLEVNNKISFCYVSGTGTDKNSNTMWARVKGETESALLTLGFKQSYMFRPAYIQPLNGIKSKTAIYNIILPITKSLYPAIKWLYPNYTTTTSQLAQSMIKVAKSGFSSAIVEAKDIDKM